MKTRSNAAHGRRWGIPAVLLAALCAAQPALAANCSPNGYGVNPKNQNSIQEFNPANNYARTLVTLGVNKSANQIASDGVALTWTQIGGPAVTLNTTNQAAPTFLTPDVTASTTLTFRLTTTCPGPGGASSTDTGTVTVLNVNRPPVAYVSATPALAYEGDTVTLDSSAPAGTPQSNDPDGDVLSYLWTRTAGPAVTLQNPTASSASFIAPTTGSAYSLTFQLRVTDPGGLPSTASVVVNVTPNLPPVAKLVCLPEQVAEGGQAVLDGSTSTQGTGGPLTYAWTQLQGSPGIVVGSETGSMVQFNAPALTAGFDGLLEFQLQVGNADGQDIATCMLQIVDVTPPRIQVPADITVEATSSAGEAVSYTALAQDAADDAAPYEIACAPPSGSVFPLAAPPTRQNTSTVHCAVTDLAGNGASADFHITVGDTTPPSINVPGSLGVEATSAAGAPATFSVPTADAVDGAGEATCVPASGGNFALGTTAITCNATDARGNSANPAGFNLTVHDTTGPVIAAHADVVGEATSAAGATISYVEPATTDLVDGSGIADCAPASATGFALGTTEVTCNASDAAGNHALPTSFSVIVRDTTPPQIAPHANLTEEATGPGGANVSYASPTTSDAVDGNGAATCAPAAGSLFPLGSTTVTCNAEDAAHNAALATTFTIFVVDTTPPTIDPHGAIDDVEATGPGGAYVPYDSPATHDLVDGDGVATCTPASGSLFALGGTIVSCQAEDAAHNHAIETNFAVNVVDTTPPTIDTHDAIGPVEATGGYGAYVDYDSPATHDVVDGDDVAQCLPVSGSAFAIGVHTVTCNATDHAGNAATAITFGIEIVDTTPPEIAAHDNVTAEATGPGGASVSYASPTTADVVDGAGVATCAPASDTTFPLGETTVHCNAADNAGNPAVETSFKVFVVDTTPPVIAAHADVGPVEATGPAGAAVGYASPATLDAVDGLGVASCAPVSGSTFGLGSNLVTCHATDAAGNHALATTFNVRVHDSTAPVIAAHGNIIAEATGPGGASVVYASPATTDAVDGAGAASCAPVSGSTFGLGTHTVSCNAADAAGNHASATSFTVTVRDTTAPVIASHADVDVIASANSSAVATYATPAASDLVDTSVNVSCVAASGSTFNAGATTINCSATDAAGNTGTSSFKINVRYGFNGFFQPVDNAAVNTVKAGSAIPVKFGLGGNQGMSIFATNSPASISTAQCDGASTDEVEVTVTAGNSSLSYDPGANQYNYVWKTDRGWVGCRQLRITFRDGSVRTAMFKFR
jgi:hypothetical protein